MNSNKDIECHSPTNEILPLNNDLPPNGSEPLDDDSQDSLVYRSKCETTSHHCCEILGEKNSYLHYKMIMSQKVIKRLYHTLLMKNGELQW